MSQIHGKQIRDGSIGLAKWDTSTGQTALLANGSMIGITDEPVLGTDLANKKYVDSIAAGLDPKESVRISTLSNINGYDGSNGVSGGFPNIDLTDAALLDLVGLTLVEGDRILVKDQDDKEENGIYHVVTAGSTGELERAPDADGTPTKEVSLGNFTFVEKGTQWASTGWVLSDTDSTQAGGVITPGIETQVWTQFSAAGSFDGGNGIDIAGSIISVDLDNNSGLHFNNNNKLRINPSFGGNGTTITSGVLDVGAGNGITVNPNNVSVTPGTGILVDSNGVHFDGATIAGTGISWNGTQLSADPTDLSGLGGLGLDYNSGVYDVGQGNGITVNTNSVEAKPGNGISVDGTGINVVGGYGITVSSTDVSVEVGHGLSVGAAGVYIDGAILAGTGVTWDGTKFNTTPVSLTGLGGNGLSWNPINTNLDVNVGDGINIDSDYLVVVGGNGITVDSNGINIDPTTAGNGMTWSGVTNEYSVEAGTGIIVSGTGVHFDGGTIAGTGISWDGSTLSADFGDFSSLDGNGLIWNTGNTNLDVNTGNGITISSDKVTAVGTNGILVDTNGIGLSSSVAGTGLTLTGGVLDVDFTQFTGLDGNGLTLTGGVLNVGAGDGISVDGTNVTAVGSKGILVDSTDNIHIDPTTAGQGLVWGVTNSQYNLDLGVGLKFNGNEVEFDGANVAGTGLSWVGTQLVAISTATRLVSEYANVTASTNDADTGFALVGTPKAGNEVKVYINGQLQRYGTGNDYYFSSDGLVGGARPIDGVETNDIFMWNGTNSGYPLETSDLVTITYDTAI